MTNHDMLIYFQRWITALQTQIAGLVAERDLLRDQLTAALSELSARNDKTAEGIEWKKM